MTTLVLILLIPVLALGFTGLTMLFADAVRAQGGRPVVSWAREGLGYLLGAIGLIGLVADLVGGALWRVGSVQSFLAGYGTNLALLGLAVILAGRTRPTES
ncbi:MAG: hypothetical protein NZ523_07780 [Elioraea sp.]|nr:hypothetical protein [Elioraea sp.]MDW8445577.1 hypothetical protein [Acetobacteraceae bacterium]